MSDRTLLDIKDSTPDRKKGIIFTEEIVKSFGQLIGLGITVAIIAAAATMFVNSQNALHAVAISNAREADETVESVLTLVASRYTTTDRRIDSEIEDFEGRRYEWALKNRDAIEDWSKKYDQTLLSISWDLDKPSRTFLEYEFIDRANVSCDGNFDLEKYSAAGTRIYKTKEGQIYKIHNSALLFKISHFCLQTIARDFSALRKNIISL